MLPAVRRVIEARPGKRTRQASTWIFIALACGCMPACQKDQGIRVYKVAKQDSKPRGVIQTARSQSSEQQMLGAIVHSGTSAWFFKLTGEPSKVEPTREEFREIVDSVEFKPTGPSWKLAKGWTQQLSQGITYAKLLKEDEGLTATVTEFPFPEMQDEAKWRDYVVANINRWRNQLALAPQEWSEIEPELEEVKELSRGPAKAYFVSLVGKGSGSMGGPFSGGPFSGGASMAPESSSTPPPSAAAEPTQSPLSYEAPDGWKGVAPSSMRLASFKLDGDDGQTAEVAVSVASGEIDMIVGMWISQIPMEKTDDDVKKVIDEASEVEVNGAQAKVYWVDGSESESKQAILVADVPWANGSSLYVKLKGDSTLVEAQRDNFMAFLNSLKW